MQIRSKRLILKTLSTNDASEYFSLSQNKGFQQFQISNYQQNSIQETSEWITKIQDYHLRNKFGIVGVFLKDDLKLIGLGALKYLKEEKKSPVELMYRISDVFWGQSYGLEIASCLIDYAFKKIKLPFLVATVDLNNIVSKNILIKLGFKFSKKIYIQSLSEDLYDLQRMS